MKPRHAHISETPATKALKSAGVVYGEHPYEYVDHGGTRVSSEALGVDEHMVVKTLVMQDEAKQPLIVLMHGDRNVSTKNLARQIGVKGISPCAPEEAQRHSGYQVGGTSPFGLRKAMRIYVERTILELPLVYVNGGRRGYLVSMDPRAFIQHLRAVPVECAIGD